MSIDLSHHLDNADDDNAAVQLVPLLPFQLILRGWVKVFLPWLTYFFFRPNYVYSCLDARFYDDEMLTVVLQGSEDENRRRVLAQVPLASTLSCETEFNWEPNLRCVWFIRNVSL